MRIAVVDLNFNWPPDGGARVDVREVFYRVNQVEEVCLFVPKSDHPDFFKRGIIKEDPGFPVQTIPARGLSFNRWLTPDKIVRALDQYHPDMVFIADGWFLKPWIARALKKYPYIVRFYAYETICLRDHGFFMRGPNACYRSHTNNLLLDYPVCNLCAMKIFAQQAAKKYYGMSAEYLGATAFLPSYPGLVRKMIRNAGFLFVYNNLLAGILSQWNDKVKIVPGGINPERFPVASKKTWEPVRIGMAGRLLDSNKGYYYLRGAFIDLLKAGLDVELWLTGNRPDMFSDLPQVHYAGWFSQETLYQFYGMVDICVVPSVWQEPFGLVALEAMSSGKPVIVTKVGGLQHLVDNGKTGLIVPAKSFKQLADAMSYLVQNPQIRQQMGEEGAQHVRKYYDWDSIVEKHYLPVFRSMTV